MEIFGIGFGELLLIAVVALIILGPERLPEAARTVGRGIAELRRTVEPARTAWNEMARDLTAVTQGNPWAVHPVLEKMTPEERTKFMAGGEMPQRVLQELQQEEAERRDGRSTEQAELPELDYPIPQAEVSHTPARSFEAQAEALDYPAPNGHIGEDRLR